MDLIIADPDSDYMAALAARLQQWQASSRIACCQDSQQLHKLIAERKKDASPAFFLYNSSAFSELDRLAGSSVWPKNWQTLAISSKNPGSQPVSTYSRFEPVSCLIDQIKARADTTGLAKSQIEQTGPAREQGRIQLVFSLCPDLSLEFYHQRMADLLEAGCQLVYLPLMPSYQMKQVQAANSGPNLSDLLLDLLGDGLADKDLGGYWQAHPDGYLQFRPPQRSDDLITCGPDVLRKLILALKERLAADPAAPLLAFIACSGLPLAWVAAVAVLCDVLHLELPQGKSFAAAAAQAEAGRLLALLPASCLVKRYMQPARPAKRGIEHV